MTSRRKLCPVLLSAILLAPARPQTPPDRVTLHEVKLLGAESLSPAEQGFVQQAVQGRLCGRKTVQLCIAQAVTNALQQEGYARAKAKTEDLEFPNRERPQDAVATVSVVPGKTYRVKELRFTGITALSSRDLKRLPQVEAGKPFNVEQVTELVGALRSAYGGKGYREAAIVPELFLDDAAQTVIVTVHVQEGAPPAKKP